MSSFQPITVGGGSDDEHGSRAQLSCNLQVELGFSHEGKPCSSGVVNNTPLSAVIF